MIERVSFYRVVCDGCGAVLSSSLGELPSLFRFRSEVEASLSCRGWHRDYECVPVTEARIYCRDCWNRQRKELQ